MAVISKQVAHDVAKLLAKKKKEEVNALVEKFNMYLIEEYNKTLPPEVVEFAKKYPHYIEHRSYIRVTGNGFRFEDFSIEERVIIHKSSNYFEPNEKVAAVLVKMRNAYKNKREEYGKLVTDIENALIQLRTYKNIEAQFPNAVEFLPSKTVTSVAINFSDIISRIQE